MVDENNWDMMIHRILFQGAMFSNLGTREVGWSGHSMKELLRSVELLTTLALGASQSGHHNKHVEWHRLKLLKVFQKCHDASLVPGAGQCSEINLLKFWNLSLLDTASNNDPYAMSCTQYGWLPRPHCNRSTAGKGKQMCVLTLLWCWCLFGASSSK